MEVGTPLQFIPGIGPLRVELFQKLGVRRATDLLFLFPRSYQDIAPYQSITELDPGVRASVIGQIVDMDQRVSFEGRSSIGILLAVDGGGYVRCVWYNQPFRRQQFLHGMRVIATGIAKSTGISFEMRHPETTILAADQPLPEAKPMPIYPLTEGLQQRHVATAVAAVLDHLTNSIDEQSAAANRVLLNGSGVATGDYDNDGWPDVFFCGLNTPCKLYRNLGNWKFKDVTVESGIICTGRYFRGAVVATSRSREPSPLMSANTAPRKYRPVQMIPDSTVTSLNFQLPRLR